MKIYKISHSQFEYDTHDGHIIAADNTDQVIELAQKQDSSHFYDIWKNEAIIEQLGEYTGTSTEPVILLSSFNAG